MPVSDLTERSRITLSLTGREVISLYALLLKNDAELGPELQTVLARTEKLLYEHLSIDEIEKLQSQQNHH
jgi:hypothetical protein